MDVSCQYLYNPFFFQITSRILKTDLALNSCAHVPLVGNKVLSSYNKAKNMHFLNN